MIRLIDETADTNEAWIHAVDIGHDFITYWTKTRRPEFDQQFPDHDRDRFHQGRQPQEWVDQRWPGKRWAAHFHIALGRPPLCADCWECAGEMSDHLKAAIAEHFAR